MTASTTRNSDHTGPPAPHPPVSGGPIVQLPTAFGDFVAQAWTDLETGHEHLAVSSPPNPPAGGRAPLVRLHSECLTGDVFGSYRCDCGEQLAFALELIHAEAEPCSTCAARRAVASGWPTRSSIRAAGSRLRHC